MLGELIVIGALGVLLAGAAAKAAEAEAPVGGATLLGNRFVKHRLFSVYPQNP